MNTIVSLVLRLSLRQRIILGVIAIALPIVIYAATIYLGFRHHPFFITPERTNGWAILTSLASIVALLTIYGFIRLWVPAAAPTAEGPALNPSRRIKVVGFVLAALVVAVCLPATFRATSHPREVMIFWHDEGATLELVQAFVEGEKDVPSYRFTQGWVTFLPVALALKGLNCLVPIDFTLTNIAMRAYGLGVIFFIIYFTYRLIWQISRSWWLAIAVVLIAYSRSDFYHITLAIDRPDTFQLLFVLLSLLYAHRFWVEGQPGAWFLAVFFAAFAFASKYSGHLLAPALLLPWIAHWRRPEVRLAYPTRWKFWAAGISLYGLCLALIFPFTFSVLNAYHLINLKEVLHFFRTHLEIYKTGNVYNLPNHESPNHIALWWDIFISGYAFDYWLTILGAAGAALALVKNAIYRSNSPRRQGEWLLLTWGVCYISFLVYQYGLVDYRYIMPVQYVLPFFLLLPILWLQQASAIGRVPYRTVLGFAAITAVFLLCSLRVHAMLQFLGAFRSEASAQSCYDVGRRLDRMIGPDENPKIMMTNLAYVPPRFTKLWINNVNVTNEFIEENRFEYVIMTKNMYDIYANKPTAGFEQQYDALYKVHYVDVVQVYTAFKNKTHPDYRFVASYGGFFDLFERVERDSRAAGILSNKANGRR